LEPLSSDKLKDLLAISKDGTYEFKGYEFKGTESRGENRFTSLL